MSDRTFPIITLEVQGMRHAVRTALTQYELELSSEVQEAVDKICTSEGVKAVILSTAKEEIDNAIKKEISEFFRYGGGRQVIKDAVSNILDKRMEESE